MHRHAYWLVITNDTLYISKASSGWVRWEQPFRAQHIKEALRATARGHIKIIAKFYILALMYIMEKSQKKESTTTV